jgi:hypothetical protein
MIASQAGVQNFLVREAGPPHQRPIGEDPYALGAGRSHAVRD